MNIKLLFYLSTFLLYNNLVYGQCDDCNFSNNSITTNGSNSFAAADTADEYYWEVCGLNVSIFNSNTSQTVTVSNPSASPYTIKLVSFNNGNCTTACKMVDGDPCLSAACPQSSNLGFFATPEMDPCFEGIISIVGNTVGQIACIDYVNWTWDIFGFPQSINGGETSENISFFGEVSSITICAYVFYKNGSACEEICRSFNLPESCNCGDLGEPPCP